MPLPQMHGRTHVPAGYAVNVSAYTSPTELLDQGTTDQIPSKLTVPGGTPVVFRAEQWNNDVTTPAGGDLEQLVFDEYTNPDTGIFTVSTGTSSGQTGLLSVSVNATPCLVIAKLAWDWEASWSTTSTQSQTAGIYDQITVWPMEGVEFPRLGPGAGSGTLDYSMTLMEYYPTIAYEQSHGGVSAPTFTFWLAQKTGVSKGAQGRMTIAYFAA